MKHRILRKIRATFLSLSEEKKATSAGVKRLRRSRSPLAYSLLIIDIEGDTPKVFQKLAVLKVLGVFF